MANLSVSFTEDMLKLVSRINFLEFPAPEGWASAEKVTWGIDLSSLYGGSYVLEDISYILGLYDKHIEGTENDPLGVQFPKETEDYMWELHEYILTHLRDIEELIHQFCNRGGLKPVTYKAKSNERIWEEVK